MIGVGSGLCAWMAALFTAAAPVRVSLVCVAVVALMKMTRERLAASMVAPLIEVVACSPKHAPSVMRVSTGNDAQETFYVRQQETQTKAA